MTPDPATARAELRARLRSERTRLVAPDRIAAAAAIVSHLEQLPEFLIDRHVAGYWAVAGELPLNIALGRLRARGQNYYLPVIAEGNTLNFAAWSPTADVRANRYGIPEPQCPPAEWISAQALDLVLVPLLGFDRQGNRLGSGAGYYDRSFDFLRGKERPTPPLLVGIGYHFQELAKLAPQSWDIPLDFIATDRELIQCTQTSERNHP